MAILSLVPDPPGAPGGVTVSLDPWEYDHAHHVGIRRATANWGTQDRASYRNTRKQDERTASVAAAIAELAVAKHLGAYWPGTVWAAREHSRFKDLPDVHPNIEVRRLRSKANRAAVRRKDLGRGLDLVVAYPVPAEFHDVQVLGWLPVEEAWEVGEVAEYDATGATRGVRVTQLRPIATHPLATRLH